MAALLILATLTPGAIAKPTAKQAVNSAKLQPGKPTLKKLGSLKELENSKMWQECAALAPAVMTEEPSVAGWVLVSWLNCSRQLVLGSAKSPKTQALALALARADKSPNLVLESSARKALREELWRSRVTYIEALFKLLDKKSLQEADRHIQILAFQVQEREQKAKILALSGEWAYLSHQTAAAEVFFQESLDLSESKSARDRLSSLQLALLRKKTEDGGKAGVASDKSKTETLSEGEQKFVDRLAGAQKNNDLISLMQDSVIYLNTYPNGKKSKWAFDRILEIYTSFLEDRNGAKVEDKSDDKNNEKNADKYLSLREKALAQMERLDASRAFELARILHRKNDYQGSLRLSERAILNLSISPQAAQINYVAGRSAQFLGDYKKAQKYFSDYLEWNSAGEDSSEVSFRLALVYYRLANYSSAIAILEKLLASNGSDKFELGSRYWLTRSLQATKNDRAESESKKLIEKFPFSYYGLKLRAEKMNLQIEPFSSSAENKAVDSLDPGFLTTYQKQNWQRALLLGSQGWVSEAFQEVLDMNFPAAAGAKIKMAQELNRNHLYWAAIKLTNESLDLDPQLRAAEYISLGFPTAYETAIQVEAERYHLSPWLVKSLIRQESAYNERATSVSRAMGLMQLIPPTAQEVAKELGLSGLDLPEDSYIPAVNLQMGTYYISKMIKQFGGNVPMGLAAYNAGPSKMQLFVKARPEVEKQINQFSSQPEDEIWFDELPWSETSFYVKAILRNTILYRLLILQEGAPPLKLEKVLWGDLTPGLAPDLKSSSSLDVSPDSQPRISR